MRYSPTQLAVVFLVSSLSTAPGSRGVCLSEDTLLSGPRSADLRPEAGPGYGARCPAECRWDSVHLGLGEVKTALGGFYNNGKLYKGSLLS